MSRFDSPARTARWAALGLALLLAGCATQRGALPACDGPWTPINAAAALQPGPSQAAAR